MLLFLLFFPFRVVLCMLWFNFILSSIFFYFVLGIVMYDNEFETKESKI